MRGQPALELLRCWHTNRRVAEGPNLSAREMLMKNAQSIMQKCEGGSHVYVKELILEPNTKLIMDCYDTVTCYR